MNAPKTFYYFAYGSNLKLDEIRRSCPTAERKWRCRLPDHALVFPRKSNGRQCGVSSVEACAGSEVWGGVYEISEMERQSLESREGYKPNRALGANAYVPAVLKVFEDGDAAKPIEVTTFIANSEKNPPLPNTEYKDLIIAGAREWNLDAKYIARLEKIVTSMPMNIPNDSALLGELKESAARVNCSPSSLIRIGVEAVEFNKHAVMPNFPPFPQIIDEAPVKSAGDESWPEWVSELVPIGSKWEKMQWPDGSITIRLVDPRTLVLAARFFPKVESKT